MERLNLKPTHKPVQNYYEALRQFKTIGVAHEGAVRSAFQTLLEHCGRQFGWKLVPEWQIKRVTSTVWAIAPHSNGSSSNIKSVPTNAAASPTTPTAKAISRTLCG